MKFANKLFSSSCIAALVCALPSLAHANPQDGVIASGSATITSAGNKLNIHQHSQKAVIDWRTFDIAPDEHTEFYQPSSSSIALNRVNSNSPSQIMGKLTANGNVVIVNQNGVLFGAGSQVDVNGLVVSTADIENEKFMSGDMKFDKAGNPDAAIINQGTITAKEAGLVGLVAPNVVNNGVISAKLGRVQLASGDTMTLDMYGDGLMEVAVSDKVKSQIVSNKGVISAQGGSIELTAAAGKDVVNSLINVEGVLDATSIGQKNGKIIISAEGSNAVKGNIAADKGKKQGSSNVIVSALLDASGANPGERGGDITVTADNIALLDGTVLIASGYEGKSNTTAGKETSAKREGAAGGDIKIGGDYLGKGDTATAQNLYVGEGVLVLNDSLFEGDAGRTIFWSDGTTQFYGNVYARALGGKEVNQDTWNATSGGNSGNGGFVETSGKNFLDAYGYVDLTASNGERGLYFLDPTDITIYGNVDPTFQSTDGTINLNTNLKLWLDASDTTKVNLTYNSMGTTATGTSGTNTITVSANTGLAVGARIRLGSAGSVTAASTLGADTYTITAISGTTITLSSNLTTNYTGSTIYQGYVSQLTDKSSAGNNATQATASAMPLWLSNGQNGLGTMLLDGSDKLQGSLVGSGIGGNASKTVLVVARSDNPSTGDSFFDIGSNSVLGHFGIGIRTTSKPTVFQWGGVDVDGANNIANGTVGIWGGVKNGNTISLYQDGANLGSATYGAANITTETYTIGEFNSAGWQLQGTVSDTILYNTNLTDNARFLVEQYQSAKWNIALTPPGTGATEVAKATASDGYSVFTTRYLERLSQSADISLQASNNITFDLKTDNLALASNKSITFTAGNDILSKSNGTVTTSGSGNITLVAGRDINISNDLDFTAAGTGSVTLRANRNIIQSGGGDIFTSGGDIILNADRDQATAAGGGISLTAGANLSSNGGKIVLGGGLDPETAMAIGTTGTSNIGVRLVSNFVLAGGGSIYMNGKGLDNSSAAYGIHMDTAAVKTTDNGIIIANGEGGSTGSGANARGINLGNSAGFETKNGKIELTGTGGNTSGGSGYGISISSVGNNYVTATGSGAIKITGTGKGTGSTNNTGVYLGSTSSSITSQGGNIEITGYGSTTSSGTTNQGVNIAGIVSTNGNGKIDITGTGGGKTTASGSNGVNNSGIVETAAGTITITGTAGTGSGGSNYGITTSGSNRTGTSGTTTGAITLVADTMSFGNSHKFNTSDNIYVQPKTPGNSMGVGTSAIGTLNIPSAVFTSGAFNPGTGKTLYLGNGVAGAIDINTSTTFGKQVIFSNQGANDISITNQTLKSSAAGDAVIINSSRNFVNNLGSNAITLSGGGRWLIYSTNPANDTINSLASNFRRFSCTYGGSCPTLGSGNGFLYSYTPLLTVTPNAITNLIYGDAIPALTNYAYTLSGYLGSDSSNDSVTGTINGSTTYTQGSNATSYNIDYSTGNLASTMGYGFTYANNATALVIGKRAITAALQDKAITYGAATPTLSATSSSDVVWSNLYTGDTAAGLDSVTFSYGGATAGSNNNAGTYTLGISAFSDNNYTLDTGAGVTTSTLTVNRAQLTVNATAGQSKTYGAADPAYTYTYTGLVNGDLSASFTGALDRAAGSNVGSYAINQGNLAATGNYIINAFNSNNFTINPAQLTVTATAGQSKTYGAADPALAYTYTGLVNGDLSANFTGALSHAGVNTGAHALTLGNLAATGNYTIGVFNSNNFTINKALLTITANDFSFNIGNPVNYTVSYSGFVNGDTAASLLTAPTVTDNAPNYTTLGTYVLTPGGAASNNYNFTYNTGVLNILPSLTPTTPEVVIPDTVIRVPQTMPAASPVAVASNNTATPIITSSSPASSPASSQSAKINEMQESEYTGYSFSYTERPVEIMSGLLMIDRDLAELFNINSENL